MSEPSGRRQRKKDETRRAIAEAAMRLFLENSFDKVTIAQIAEAADVSVNTVFNYFPTKEDLFFGSHPGGESGLAGLAMAREPHETVIAFLRRFLDERHRAIRQDPDQPGRNRVHGGHAPGVGGKPRAYRSTPLRRPKSNS